MMEDKKITEDQAKAVIADLLNDPRAKINMGHRAFLALYVFGDAKTAAEKLLCDKQG